MSNKNITDIFELISIKDLGKFLNIHVYCIPIVNVSDIYNFSRKLYVTNTNHRLRVFLVRKLLNRITSLIKRSSVALRYVLIITLAATVTNDLPSNRLL